MNPIRFLAAAALALAALSGVAQAQATHNPGGIPAYDSAQDAMRSVPGSTSVDGSTAIVTGGAAQALFGGLVPTNGFKVAYPSATSGSNICWVSDTTTTPSATTAGSYPVYQQGQWSTEPGEKPAGPVYINCPTTGQAVSAKKW